MPNLAIRNSVQTDDIYDIFAAARLFYLKNHQGYKFETGPHSFAEISRLPCELGMGTKLKPRDNCMFVSNRNHNAVLKFRTATAVIFIDNRTQ